MTKEEIKKLSVAYAEYMCPVGDYCGGVYDEQRNTDLPIYKDDAKSVLEWLSKDYCIVPKSQLKELYDCYKQHEQVTDKKGLHDAMLIARGSIATMQDLFGKELFNEEK